MAWKVGRTPPASGYMITAGHGPAPSGVCRLASQVPSGVGISTSRWVIWCSFFASAPRWSRRPAPSTVSAVASRNRSWFDSVIADYIDAHTAQPDDIQRDLIEETQSATGRSAGMQIGSDQGSLMALLVRL